MPNYANGKVYKICSHNSDDVYYGSTCLKLCQRLANHVNNWRLFKQGKTYAHRITSFLIFDQGNYYIELVENAPCSSKDELHIRERFWLKNHPCVNFHKNLVSTPEEKKQHDALYRKNNKQKIRDLGIQYRALNKDAIKDIGIQYRALNKDIIKIKKKEYAERYAERTKIHNSEYFLCDCGKYYMHGKRARHVKTDFHKENVNLVMFSQFLNL